MSPVCIPIKHCRPFFPVRCIYFLPVICSCSHQCCQMFVRYLWSHLWCWTCLSSLPASSFIFIWEKEKMTFAFGFLINYISLIYSVWIIQRLDIMGKKLKNTWSIFYMLLCSFEVMLWRISSFIYSKNEISMFYWPTDWHQHLRLRKKIIWNSHMSQRFFACAACQGACLNASTPLKREPPSASSPCHSQGKGSRSRRAGWVAVRREGAFVAAL